MFKKYITTFLMALIMAAMIPVFAETASAQTRRYYRNNSRSSQLYKRPNVYRRHRKAFNVAIGTGAGALVGGLLGGKKWALIGGLAGAGGGALFTHKQKPKNYVRRFRRY